MTKKSDAPAIRFKGFSDAWEQRKFGEVFDCTVPNNTLSRAELSYDEGTVLNVHYGDVLIKYGSVLDVQKDDIPRIPHRCREDFNGALLQDGDIIIADTAEDETTGKACEISNLQGSVIVSGLHTMVCRPRNRMALGYLGYYLNSNAYHHQLLPLMQGIKVLSLSRSNIQKTSVSYPTAVKEQQHIAYYFSQLDNLITLHQRQPFLHSTPEISLTVQLIHPFYTSSWEQRKLSEITDKVTEKNAGLQYVETFTNSAEFGIISQRDFFDHDIAKLGSLDGYYIVKNEDFVYNPRISTSAPVGPINRNKLGRTGVMSPLYTVFRPHDIDTTYLEYFFKCGYWHSFMNFNGDSGARSDRFSIRDNVFFQMPIPIPDIDEQRKIGELLTCLDNLITLHQRKFEKLTNVKKSMLEKMFPQNGSSYPEIRFKGFTDPWEQRKLGELVDVCSGRDYKHLSEGTIPVYGTGGYMLSVNDALSYDRDAIGIGRKGTIDRPYILKAPFWTVDTLFYAIPREKVDLNYAFDIFQNIDWKKKDESTGVPSLSKTAINDIDVLAPKHDEQQIIGQFFAAIDNLITLHQRKPFLMKWRTSDANRNQTNRLVL